MKDDKLKEEIVKELEKLSTTETIIDLNATPDFEFEIIQEVEEERKLKKKNFVKRGFDVIKKVSKFIWGINDDFMEDLKLKREIEKRGQIKKLHALMHDGNIEIVHKIQTLLTIAQNSSAYPWNYKFRNATIKTAKLYLMGIVKFLKQYEDTRNAWQLLDLQFDDYYLTFEEKYLGINRYDD